MNYAINLILSVIALHAILLKRSWWIHIFLSLSYTFLQSDATSTSSPSDCSLEASYFLNLVNRPWHKVVLLLKVTWPYNDTFISACQESIFQQVSKFNAPNPLDTGRKLNVYRTFRRRSGRLLYALFTFNFCLVFKVGYLLCKSD